MAYIRYPAGSSGSPSFPLLAPSGSAGAPSYSFSAQPSTGWYLKAVNDLRASVGGNDVERLTNTGVVTLGDITNSITAVVDPTGASPILSFTGAISGNNVRLRVGNQSNTAASNAIIESFVAGSSAGNPIFRSNVNDTSFWSWGLNQAATNEFEICAASSLGSSKKIVIGNTASDGVQLLGTGGTGNAPAGFIGEYNESVVSSLTNVTGASNVWGNATSISLTAGDWDLTGQVYIVPNGATITQTAVDQLVAVSLFSGATTTDHVFGSNVMPIAAVATGSNQRGGTVCAYRITLASTSTVYLKQILTYLAATPQYQCRLSARRMR